MIEKFHRFNQLFFCDFFNLHCKFYKTQVLKQFLWFKFWGRGEDEMSSFFLYKFFPGQSNQTQTTKISITTATLAIESPSRWPQRYVVSKKTDTTIFVQFKKLFLYLSPLFSVHSSYLVKQFFSLNYNFLGFEIIFIFCLLFEKTFFSLLFENQNFLVFSFLGTSGAESDSGLVI